MQCRTRERKDGSKYKICYNNRRIKGMFKKEKKIILF